MTDSVKYLLSFFNFTIISKTKQSPQNLLMELPLEVQQALRELPPAERVAAYALKRIYEKIGKIKQKENNQTLSNRNAFVEKYKNIESKSASIICGKKLDYSELSNPDQYFVEQEKNELKNLLGLGEPIKNYWHDSIKNSAFKHNACEEDWKHLIYLRNISSKIKETTIQIQFTFQGSNEIQNGVYRRVTELDNGLPKKYYGDKLKMKKPLTQGLLFDIFEDGSDQQKLYSKFDITTYMVNDLIPESVRYFLGQIIEDDEDQGDDEDQFDGVGDQQQEQDEISQQKQVGRKKN